MRSPAFFCQKSYLSWIIADGFQSELATELEVTGIPRYLLLDAEGRIANANAPPPSDEEAIRKLLEELIRE